MMKTSKSILLSVIVLIAFTSFAISAYADDCAALGGSIIGGECQIDTLENKTGSYSLDETLHILPNSYIDAKGAGITLNVDGDVMLDAGSKIKADDDAGAPNNPAFPITIDATGNLELNANSAIKADNKRSGGNAGDITINVDGNIHLKPFSNISATRPSSVGNAAGNGGNIDVNAGGNINLDVNSVVSSANFGGDAGDISMTANGKIEVDGLVSAGSSNKVLSTKLTGFILDRGNTEQRGGTITITSNSVVEPGIVVGENAVIVSQGEDPASDKIKLEACGIVANGLVGSVSKKSNKPGNSPVVVLRSGTTIEINGQDLGDAGSSQGMVRADYVIGETPRANMVDLFANGKISVNGALSSNIFAVTSNGGTSTNQFGGTIRAISLADAIVSSAKAFQAKATTAGSDGGKVNLSARSSVDVDTSTIEVPGDFNPSGGLGLGGKIDARSYSNDVSWFTGVGDVQPTGTGVAISKRGTVNLTACTTVDTTGTLFPSSGTPTVPGVLTSVCAPLAPSLPANEEPLPLCEEPHQDIPEFTAITGAAAVLGALGYVFLLRRKKR